MKAEEEEVEGKRRQQGEGRGVGVKQGTEELWGKRGVRARESRFSTDGTPGLQ